MTTRATALTNIKVGLEDGSIEEFQPGDDLSGLDDDLVKQLIATSAATTEDEDEDESIAQDNAELLPPGQGASQVATENQDALDDLNEDDEDDEDEDED